ncbi:MAG: permease prefix domain 1-containing protein [Tissierellia bacterium]|nr:permease prefix domain 1-containing protein [Tissierellia bacterium]
MDTIRVYLDNMFKSLPNSHRVREAKAELYSMMEDKYSLLKDEGKSENEAIGIVISEFGNLDEVAEVLGISKEVDQDDVIPLLNHEEVVEAVEIHKLAAPKIALGVMIIMFGVSILISFISLQELNLLRISEEAASYLGVFFLILAVAFAVYNFISYGSRLNPYEKYEKEQVSISYKDRKYLEDIKEGLKFNMVLAKAVMMFIVSPLPIILASFLLESNEGYITLAVAFTIFFIAIGVYSIVRVGIVDSLLNKLLQIGDYTPYKKETNRKYNHLFSAYWMIVFAGYFIYSMITYRWDVSWIVWPIAGVVFGVINVILVRE